MGSLVSQLMSRKGYGQRTINESLQDSVRAAVGDAFASSVEVGNVRRGVLQVYVTDSVMLQELGFQKTSILKRIHQDHPQADVTDIRFRIQSS